MMRTQNTYLSNHNGVASFDDSASQTALANLRIKRLNSGRSKKQYKDLILFTKYVGLGYILNQKFEAQQLDVLFDCIQETIDQYYVDLPQFLQDNEFLLQKLPDGEKHTVVDTIFEELCIITDEDQNIIGGLPVRQRRKTEPKRITRRGWKKKKVVYNDTNEEEEDEVDDDTADTKIFHHQKISVRKIKTALGKKKLPLINSEANDDNRPTEAETEDDPDIEDICNIGRPIKKYDPLTHKRESKNSSVHGAILGHIDDFQDFVELVLCFNAFIHYGDTLPVELKSNVAEIERRTKLLVNRYYTLVFKGEGGNDARSCKIHSHLHPSILMKLFGSMMEFDSGVGERGLKRWAKQASKTAQNEVI
jgi:hypothetical protein